MAKKAKLQVTTKYIVNEGLPNEAAYEEIGEACWIKKTAKEELEYHIAKWKGKYGIINGDGTIVYPFDYDQSATIIQVDESTAYAIMKTHATNSRIITHVIRLPKLEICVTLGKVDVSVQENYIGKPYIFVYEWQNMNTQTIYNKQFRTKLGWSYLGYDNALKYMYSFVTPMSEAYSSKHQNYTLLSANGDAYRLNYGMEISNYEGSDEYGKDKFGFYVHPDLRFYYTERYYLSSAEKRVYSQNAFFLEGGIHDPNAVKDTIPRRYLVVLIPEDAEMNDFRLKDCLIYDLYDYYKRNRSESDQLIKEAEQYILM